MKKQLAIIALAFISLSASALEKTITQDQNIGCQDRDYYDKLIRYAVDKDMDAFSQGLTAGILSGQCVMFEKGEKVYVADTAVFSGMIKLRKKGSMAEYWTVMEAVSENKK